MSFCPVDGEVLEDDPTSIIGTVLDGQYQVETLLGKGGMGAVYSARHILLGDRVAIKILPPEVRTNAEWLRRFRREGQAARRFRHPNAVTVYDLRTAADGTIYMVMEYVEGHTLGEEIKKRGRFSPTEVLEILQPIMSVLHTAHSMGVVHRDLKPDNIMIGKGGNGEPVIKLLDLGIAKMREIAGADTGGNTALTMAGQILGTPHYMSPEQWGEIQRDGDPEVDGRADLYSLGLVTYEMVLGKRPFSAVTLHELRREHISVTPQPLSDILPEVPRGFSDAISRAMEKDRADRPATAEQFAAELRDTVGTGFSSANLERTVPDLPHIEASRSHTAEVNPASDTASDVNAPTILTLDPSTSGGRGGSTVPQVAREAPARKAEPVMSGFTPSAAAVDTASVITQIRQPSAQVAEAPKKSGKLLLVGAGALVLLLVVAVGGFFAFRQFNSKPNSGSPGNSGQPADAVATAPKDVAHYWLETLPDTPEAIIGEPVRVAGNTPLASGQSFKFHFTFPQDGYVYIVGPGEQNKPTAFLTSKPPEISGLTSNNVSKDDDFSFPDGVEHWLKLDKKAGTEDYTIVFSPTALSSPGFFTAQATGTPLSESEQREFADFVSRNKKTAPLTEINGKDASQPFVAVKLPQSDSSGNPIVFGIRIEHK